LPTFGRPTIATRPARVTDKAGELRGVISGARLLACGGCVALDSGSSVRPDLSMVDTQTSSRAEAPALSAHSGGRGEASSPPTGARRVFNLSLAVATAVPVLLFLVFPPLSKSGLWDPYELNIADLSRRIALNLYHADSLALAGADNSLPHLNDLGRPQLPFSSIALGFKLFGLQEWAGRLPLALWGVLGVVATYAFVARLFDRRAGVYAAVVLSTMPLYFVQARSMMGEVCAMAGLAMAFGGLAVAVFDRQPVDSIDGSGAELQPTPWSRRAPWLLMGATGLFVGLESRGALLGVAVPLAAVGAAWAVTRVATAHAQRDRVGDAIGGVACIVGLAITIFAVRAASQTGRDVDLLLGSIVRPPSKYATFDYFVAAIGHALAPWSAFLPFAVGRVLIAPSVPRANGAAAERESQARVAILIGLGVAFVAHAYLVDRTDLSVFTGPALCAAICAVAIRDFERGARTSVAVSVGVFVLAAVLHHDFHELPEKAYQAFGVTGATFPEGFKDTALTLWWVVLGLFAAFAFLTWIERDPKRAPFDPATYASVFRSLREAFGGALAVGYAVVIGGAAMAGLVLFVGLRLHAQWLPQMSATIRDLLLNAWWRLAVAPLGLLFGLIFACDFWLWAFGGPRALSRQSLVRGFEPFEELFGRLTVGLRNWKRTDPEWWFVALVLAPLMLAAIPLAAFEIESAIGIRPATAAAVAISAGLVAFLVFGVLGDVLRHRAAALVFGGGVSGFILCFWYYPALANQLSPKDVFEAYRRACPGAPLALLGVGGRTSAYYAGGQPQTFGDPTSAYHWLAAGGAQRRCLALKAEELPRLNQLWRQRADEPRTNVPIVDAKSSQILLAASSLAPSDKNENPLSEFVLSTPPRPWRRIEANLEDKIEVLGIDIVDDRGRLVDFVSAGRDYHLRTYYKVLAPVTTEWEAFVHIDGYHRRHNGDHKPLSGKYPMSLWLVGDLLVDDSDFKLEPNFTPGTYQIFFGLFVGDTRLKVLNGPNDGENRINGGDLRVQ
jgi:4-amino-4-deoxy-L-arabinose transferase-like glycosyltransferase